MRTVGIELVAELRQYLGELGKGKRATDDLTDSLKDTTVAGLATEAALGSVGDEMSDAARAAQKLDREIDGLKRSLAELAVQSALTGDVDIAKKMRGQQGELRKLMSAKKLLPDASEAIAEGVKLGARIADGMGMALQQAGTAGGRIFSSLPPQVQAIMGGVAVAAVAAVAPTIGAGIAGAVVGGAGAGGMVGGFMIAARDPAVKAATASLGSEFSAEMERAGRSFVPVTLDALSTIRGGMRGMEGDFEAVFAGASRYVDPLVQGVMGLAREAMPGIIDAVERAGPVFAVISDRLPKIGLAVSDALDSISGDANGAAAGIDLILEGLGGIIRISGQVIGFFVDMFRNVVNVADAAVTMQETLLGWNPLFSGKIEETRTRIDHLKEILNKTGEEGKDAGPKAAGGIGQIGGAAATAAPPVERLNDAIKRMMGENLSAEQASLALTEAIQRATQAGAENNAGIDAGTPKAIANRQALLGIASSAAAARDAIFTQTGSQELASQATEKGRTAFLKAADAMGVGSTEAQILANKLFGIPRKVDTKITVTANTQPAIDAAKGVVARINNMHARINVSAEPSGGYGGSAHTGDGYSTGQRWGGVHVRAATGALRDAAVYSPMGPARYAFAEPATGGEAFIPKNGNTDRSLGILSKAASWYGAQVMPRYMPGRASASAPAAASSPAGNPAQFAQAIRSALVGVNVVMNGQVVGQIQGRAADLYARSGG